MLEKPNENWKPDQLPPISAPWKATDLSKRVNILQRISQKLRKNREDDGALRLDVPKLCFSLDKETGLPMVSFKYELVTYQAPTIFVLFFERRIGVALSCFGQTDNMCETHDHLMTGDSWVRKMLLTFRI